MLEELKNISPYVYNLYTENDKIKPFKKKTFELKTLSIVDTDKTTTLSGFIKERLKGMEIWLKQIKFIKMKTIKMGLNHLQELMEWLLHF